MMAYFAEVDQSNLVLRVIVSDTLQWILDRLGGLWAETKIADPVEAYAGPGYHGAAFAPPKYVADWYQPDSPANGYAKGQWAWSNGPWRSNHANNTATPGGADWRQYLEEWPQWTNPNGPNGPYYVGDKVTQATKHWVNTVDGNTATPSAPSSGWDEVLESTAPTKGKP